jgi:hypothetical protein
MNSLNPFVASNRADRRIDCISSRPIRQPQQRIVLQFPVPKTEIGAPYRRVQARLAVVQRQFDALARVDIESYAGSTDRAPGVVARGGASAAHDPTPVSGSGPEPVLRFIAFASTVEQCLVSFVEFHQVVGVNVDVPMG